MLLHGLSCGYTPLVAQETQVLPPPALVPHAGVDQIGPQLHVGRKERGGGGGGPNDDHILV